MRDAIRSFLVSAVVSAAVGRVVLLERELR